MLLWQIDWIKIDKHTPLRYMPAQLFVDRRKTKVRLADLVHFDKHISVAELLYLAYHLTICALI